MTVVNPNIRAAKPDDAPALGRLSIELGYLNSVSETTDRLTLVLEFAGHSVLVAETAEGEIVGWVHVFGTGRVESNSFAELGGLVVTESWRSRGVGTQLVVAAENWAFENGYRTMRIRSREERSQAHRLFRRLGFDDRKSQIVFDRSLNGNR